MAHSFTVKTNIQGELSSHLEQVKKSIIGQGGDFKGDAKGGRLVAKTPVGNVTVDYIILPGNAIKLTIADKPFVLSNSKIESTLREYLA